MTGPFVNQCSAARSIEAATHWNGSGSSSIRAPASSSVSSLRSVSFENRCVRLRIAVLRRVNREPSNTPPESSSVQTFSSRSTQSRPGSAAKAEPLIAPTDVPRTRSGSTPASSSARSMPTS
jgi:hypothetical protein